MRTNRKWLVTALAFSLSGAMLYAIRPGPPGRGADASAESMHRPPPPVPPAEVLQDLGVSEEQIASLRDIEYASRKKAIDLHADVERAELELRRIMDSDAPDEDDVMEAAEKVNRTRGELFKSDLLTRLKVQRLLGVEIIRKLHEPGRHERTEMQEGDLP